MKNKYIILRMCFFVMLICFCFNISAEEIANPYIDITFDGIIKENKNHATIDLFGNSGYGPYGNNIVNYGVDEYGTYMQWTSNYPNGGGFRIVSDKAIGEEYTIALKFSFNDTGREYMSWKKIIDFQKKDDDEDSGLYFYDYGKMQFYPKDADGPRIENNQVVDLLIRRNKNTKKFDVYNRVNNESILCYEFTDNDGLSILLKGLGFFHNDEYQTGECTDGGKVYSVKIWDSYLEVDEVWDALDKERDLAVSKYICKLIEGKSATELLPGWKDYYECEDKEDGTIKYFEDADLSVEITNIEEWKTENGYISPTIDNPQTGDNISLYLIISFISICLVWYIVFYLRKVRNSRLQ